MPRTLSKDFFKALVAQSHKTHKATQKAKPVYMPIKKPYRDPNAWDGLSEGSWLVIVKPNGKSARRLLNPGFAEVAAALEEFKEEMVMAMGKANEMRPKVTPISEKEQKAWKAFQDTMGDDMPKYFEYASLSDIAQAGCDIIQKKVENKIKYENYNEPISR